VNFPNMTLERWAVVASITVAVVSLLTAGLGFIYTRAQMNERTAISNEMARLRDERQELEIQAIREAHGRLMGNDSRQDEILRNLCAARARDDRESGRSPDPYLCNAGALNGRNGG
jgi:hypothetical protein